MSNGRSTGRESDPRARSAGPGPRTAARRTSTQRAGSRPGTRPAARPGGGRPRSSAAARQAPPRPRLTSRAAVLVLVLAVLMVSYASSMRAFFEQRRHLSDLNRNIAASEENITRLEREKQRWNDPAFVRAVAHQRFGWVLPGEIGFQVIDENGKPLGHQDSLPDPDSVTEANRPMWWQSAWGSVVEAGKPEVDPSDVPPPATKIKPPQPTPKPDRGQRR